MELRLEEKANICSLNFEAHRNIPTFQMSCEILRNMQTKLRHHINSEYIKTAITINIKHIWPIKDAS